MADAKVSALTSATTPLTGSEELHVIQGGNSRKVTTSAFYIFGGTDVAVTDGGTGASDASGARTNLGLVIGTDVQAYDASLAAISALTTTTYGLSFLEYAEEAAFKAGVNLEIGTDVQAWNALLDAIAGLTLASGDVIYATGPDAVAKLGIGSSGEVLKVSAGGLPEWGTVAGSGDVIGPASSVTDRIATYDGTTGKILQDSGQTVAGVLDRANHTGTQLAATISDFSTAADARISAAIGSDVQAYSANLDAWSALSTSAKQDQDPNLTTLAGAPTGNPNDWLRINAAGDGYDILPDADVISALNVKALNADGGFTLAATQATQDWDTPFGGTYKSANRFRLEDASTFTGGYATVSIEREGPGSGANGAQGSSEGLQVSSVQTDWLTTGVLGQNVAINTVVRTGAEGDAAIITGNIHKVANTTYGFTGFEAELRLIESDNSVLKRSKVVVGRQSGSSGSTSLVDTGEGIGFYTRAIEGNIGIGLAVVGDTLASGDGYFDKVLVAARRDTAASRYFQITSGTDKETAEMHFGSPSSETILRHSSDTFQIMSVGKVALVNVSHLTKHVDMFGGLKVTSDANAARLTRMYSAEVALDFPSIAAGGAQQLTATLTGVASGDEITVTPVTNTNGLLAFKGEYDSANTVRVWAINPSTGAIDPGSYTIRVTARRYA